MASTSAGIDVGLLRGKGLDLVVLDENRRLIHCERRLRDLGYLTELLSRFAPAIVCIDSPSDFAPAGERRLAELELLRRGINLYSTPSEERARPFHEWMRDGFTVYAAIAHLYPRYRGGHVRGHALECFPHATTVALTGTLHPFADKVRVRRALLAEHGIDETGLLGPDQVDAALAALTGVLALEGTYSVIGGDGDAMLVPIKVLPERFPRVSRGGHPAASSRKRPDSRPLP